MYKEDRYAKTIDTWDKSPCRITREVKNMRASLLGPLDGLNMPPGGFLWPGAVSKCHFRA